MGALFDAKALTVTAAGGGGSGFTSPQTNTTLTVGPNGTLLIAAVALGDTAALSAACTGVQWGNVPMTELPGSPLNETDNLVQVAVFGLLNPASGNQTLTATFTGTTGGTGNQRVYIDCFSFTGTDTTSIANCIPSSDTITAATIGSNGLYTINPQAVTTVIGDMALAVMNTASVSIPAANVGILINEDNALSGIAYGSIYNPAIGPTTSLQFSGMAAGFPNATAIFYHVLQGTAAQTRPPHVTKLKSWVYPPTPQQAYNLNLYTTVVIQTPFNQYDWSKPFQRLSLPPNFDSLNPNVFTNPYPFNQIDWSKSIRVPQAPFSPTDPLNINLFTNPIPFTQIDWSKPFRIPLSLPQPSPPLNINLFTNPYPFNQYDWAKSVRIPQAPIDLSVQFNQNLTNFFPFNQTDWSKPFNVPHAPFDLSVSLNPNIFTNPFPFLNIDTSRPGRLAGLPQVDTPYNQPLYTVIISILPFNQIDWSKPFTVPHAPFDLSVSLNPNIFTNPFPILATDQLPIFKVPLTLPQPSPPLNINLFTNPYPFLNIDSSIVPLRRASVLPDQAYNQSLYTVTVTAPFYAAEILISRRPVSSPLLDPPLNINLFTNPYPFNQYDFLKLLRTPQAPFSPDQALNINLFTNPIPVFNYDTSVSVRLKGFVDTSQPYNVNLYGVVTVQVPFNQSDWSKAFVPKSVPTQDQALNINLFTNPIPFSQYDWRKPFGVPHAPFDLSVQTNPNLFKNPFPFNQYQYPTQRPVRLGPPHVPPYNQNLYTATLGTTSHIVKFIGNVGHFMIR